MGCAQGLERGAETTPVVWGKDERPWGRLRGRGVSKLRPEAGAGYGEGGSKSQDQLWGSKFSALECIYNN